MYSTILFDLDGTLTDSGPGILNSVAYALEKSGIPVPDRQKLRKFMVPPLSDSFRNYCGMSDSQAQEAITYYREYFTDRGIFENSLYDGIDRLLATLSHAGYRLLTATSKPEVFAIQILEYFHIRRYFSFVAGATMDGSRSSKCDVISYALSSAKISDPSCAIMIGDRKYDILGARQCGLSAVGVLYGYGSRRELESAGADYLAATVSDIYPVFISEK